MDESIRCFECFYSIFGNCPVNGRRGNAACLQMAKSYIDMSSKELKQLTEKEYKESLCKAAKLYNIRMDYINILSKNKNEKEENDDGELESLH